ncbi:hypothetical protein [Microcella sp.]|uniref:hypothetical protein n=1 Tax=Microcella sp. TaxID=1913979 RepID=UPI00391B2659
MGERSRTSTRFGMLRARPARRAAATLSALVAIAALTAGCATQPALPPQPQSIADAEGAGWPPGAPVPEREWEGPIEPIAWWNEGPARNVITFISYGSSSCPFVLTALEVLADDRLSATFQKGAADACTDDLAAHFHIVSAPEGVTADEVFADVEWREPRLGDEDWVQAFTIMVIDPNREPVDVPASVALDEYPGLPALLPEPAPDAEQPDGPLAYWLSPVLELADDRELTIVTYGSSSCPLIPTAVDAGLASDTIGVTLQERRAPNTFCTADFAPFTSVLAIPLTAAAEATRVEFSTLVEGSERQVTTVDIVDLAG